MNTSYFQSVVNQRKRKIIIHCIEGPDGEVNTTDEILTIIKICLNLNQNPM